MNISDITVILGLIISALLIIFIFIAPLVVAIWIVGLLHITGITYYAAVFVIWLILSGLMGGVVVKNN